MESATTTGAKRAQRVTEQIVSEFNKRILIVKLSSLGDVVMSLPVAAALRRHFPSAYLAWAVGPAAADVLTGNPHLDDVLVIGGKENQRGMKALPPLREPGELKRELKRFDFDLTLDLQGLFKSAAVAYLSGARERIGFRSWREGIFLLNNRRLIPYRPQVHAVDLYLDFASALGAAKEPVEFPIAISQEDQDKVDELLGTREKYVALIPGARWESKLWPAARFAAVAEKLADEFGLTSVVIGAARDKELAMLIAAACKEKVLDLTGQTTLKQAAEIFRRCRVTIGNDTGPLYLSSAMRTPTIAIFGPSDARRLGPYGEGHAKVTAGVACAPCRNRQCRSKKCLEAISVEQVLAAARNLLAHAPVRQKEG